MADNRPVLEVPRYAPLIIADRIVGLQLAGAISTALVHRERTGEGQRVDVPMFEGLLSVVLGEHLVGMLFEPPLGPAGYKRSLSPDRRPHRGPRTATSALLSTTTSTGAHFSAPSATQTDSRQTPAFRCKARACSTSTMSTDPESVNPNLKNPHFSY